MDSSVPASLSERTASDYAIEHGGYLARSVTAFLDMIGRDGVFDEDAQQHLREEVSDHLQAMRSGVYEFEKRAARAVGVAALRQQAAEPVEKEDAKILRDLATTYLPGGRRDVKGALRRGAALLDAAASVREPAQPDAVDREERGSALGQPCANGSPDPILTDGQRSDGEAK